MGNKPVNKTDPSGGRANPAGASAADLQVSENSDAE